MSSHPDFHSYFETDALVRLDLHCKTLLPSKFVAEKIFFTYKMAINCFCVVSYKFSLNHCVELLTATTWN